MKFLEGGRRAGATIATTMLLSMAACERPVGDPSPVAMPGTSDGPAVEIQEQPADTVESQPTKFTTKDATSRATRVSTLPSTQESMGPAESRVVPCYLPTAYSSVDGNLQWAPEAFVEWSPVGAEILYNEWHNLYGVAADGLLVRHVARTSQPEPPPRERILSFDIARDGRRVVYSACEYMGQRPEFRIVTTGIDGTQVRRFAVGDYLDIYPAWSPDGRRIALLRGHRRLSRGKIAMLVTMSADGTEQRTVEMSLDRLALWPPEWSPNGERIAFVGLRDGDSGWGLHTVGYDGGDVKRLTDTLSGPEWSPDGERIAFAKADGEEAAIYTIAADGTDLRRVTTIPGWDAERLVPEPSRRRIHTVEWSPDGSKILFIDDLLLEHDGRWAWGDPEGGPGGVYVVGADGSGLVRVLDMCLVTRTLGRERTLEVVSYTAAGWSPDGTRIAVSIDFNLKSTRDGSEVHILLLTMDPDGSNRRVLAHGSRVNMTALGSEPTRPYAAPRACAEGLVITNPEANAGLVADCETLLGIRDKLAGAGTLRWFDNGPMSEWEGVEIGGTPLRVRGLRLSGLGLQGEIPAEVSRLTELRELDLSGNELKGAIPAELGELKKLERLDVSGNNLSGGMPAELGGLGELGHLSVADNFLHGEIPAELGRLRKLTELYVSNNQLTRSILTLSEVIELYLTRGIPTELGACHRW